MKKIYAFFAAALMSISAMAGTVTFEGADFAGLGAANNGKGAKVELTKNGVTVSTNMGYGDGKCLRVYQGGDIVITSSQKMTNVDFSCNSAYASIKNQTPNSTTCKVTAPSGTGVKHVRIEKITITVDGDVVGGEEGEGEGDGEDLNYTVNFKYAEVYNFFDYLTDDSENITIYLYGEEEDPYEMQIDLLVKAGTGIGKQLPEGTYKIDETFAVGSAVVGFEDEETEEVLGTWFTDWENLFMFPAMGGTVTVGKNSISVNMTYKDEEGVVSVKANYSGDLTIEEGEFDEDETGIMNTEATVKVQKTIENGQLVIRRGEQRYNVMGQNL